MFERVFGKPMTLEHWRWKLGNKGTDNVFVATEGSEIIFQYAGMPVRISAAERELDGMISVDTMTAPEHRKKGLLTRVGSEVYERWRASGVELVLGIPNDNWGSRDRQLGWRFLLQLRCWIRPLSPLKLLFGRFGGLGRFLPPLRYTRRRLNVITAVDERFDNLWSSWLARRPNCCSVVRNARWVRWRFFEAPGAPYTVFALERRGHLRGYGVLRVDGPIAFVPEIFAEDNAARRAILSGLATEARLRGAEKLQMLCPERSDLERDLWRCGFVFPRERFAVKLVPLSELATKMIDREWDVMGSDFDFQ